MSWTSTAQGVQKQAAVDYEGRPPAYSSLLSRITFLQGKPLSGAPTNYRTRERMFWF